MEIIALRHLLSVLQSNGAKAARLTASDRLLWIWFSRLSSDWRSWLLIVRPEMSSAGIELPGRFGPRKALDSCNWISYSDQICGMHNRSILFCLEKISLGIDKELNCTLSHVTGGKSVVRAHN